jgi:hypothetical protein
MHFVAPIYTEKDISAAKPEIYIFRGLKPGFNIRHLHIPHFSNIAGWIMFTDLSRQNRQSTLSSP